MRVMVIVKATKDSEAGVMPSKELLTAMGNYLAARENTEHSPEFIIADRQNANIYDWLISQPGRKF